MIAVNIVGYKNTGKTTLATSLAKELIRRGKTVSAMKLSHHDLDFGTNDSANLASVCSKVCAIGADSSMALWREKKFAPDMLVHLNADVLIVEGGKTLGWLPRIIIPNEESAQEAHKSLSPHLAIASYKGQVSDSVPSIDTIEDLADRILAKGFILPALDCGNCEYGVCKGMTAGILSGKNNLADCKAMSAHGLEIKVNGVRIGLTPFVEDIIAGSIEGMLRTLKGFSAGDITIEMKVKS